MTDATLPDGRTHIPIAVQDGRIVEVTHGLQAPAAETLDAQGQLVSPPFVDAHFHLDATLSYGLPRINASGTLFTLYVSKLLPLLAESGGNIIANPLINITLQDRHDTYLKRRGMTRVPELLAHGVPVAFGQDCCMDPW